MSFDLVVGKLRNTFVSDIPGVKLLYSASLSAIEWKYQILSGEKWIEYNGAELYVDTSDLVAKRLAIQGEYETTVEKNIENHLNKGDIAIDIGAHIGHHSVTMRQCVGSDGRVLMFEPNPINVNYIKKKNNIRKRME